MKISQKQSVPVCRRESARQLQLSGNQAAEDRVCRVAVDDLVLSQVDKPKNTYQPMRFRMKLLLSV